MKKISLKHSCYNYYDRLGENVDYDYTIQYDWNSIMENDINEDNFKIIPVGFDKDSKAYFKRYHINEKEWNETLKNAVLNPNNDLIKEDFFESLPENIYEQYENKWYPD